LLKSFSPPPEGIAGFSCLRMNSTLSRKSSKSEA
jgi:hypothetical protein